MSAMERIVDPHRSGSCRSPGTMELNRFLQSSHSRCRFNFALGKWPGRYPPTAAGIQVNFCRNPACANFGVPPAAPKKRGRRPKNEPLVAAVPGDYTVVAYGKGQPGRAQQLGGRTTACQGWCLRQVLQCFAPQYNRHIYADISDNIITKGTFLPASQVFD
jgi:hypothetical protein